MQFLDIDEAHRLIACKQGAATERFYSGEWLAGIRARYGTEPKITYFETVALTDKASGQASGLD
jgi:hypothetical protein